MLTVCAPADDMSGRALCNSEQHLWNAPRCALSDREPLSCKPASPKAAARTMIHRRTKGGGSQSDPQTQQRASRVVLLRRPYRCTLDDAERVGLRASRLRSDAADLVGGATGTRAWTAVGCRASRARHKAVSRGRCRAVCSALSLSPGYCTVEIEPRPWYRGTSLKLIRAEPRY